jgi:hypothetical protein
MAKEAAKPEKSGKGAKRKHLKEIRSVHAEDGSIVHHHTYMRDKNEPHSIEPERGPMATSATPEEAGQHVAEQFGMNGAGDGDVQGGEPEEGQPAE